MLPRFEAFWDRLHTSLWFVPVVMSLGAMVLALGGLQVRLGFGSDGTRIWWLHQGNGSDARSLLTGLMSSMITMASLVISITMVVLTLAAGQLGPRLIRSFMADGRTQAVLGFFIATIVYLLVLLSTLDGKLQEGQVPHLAVTAGVALVLLCVFTLLFYVHHLARSIVADTVVARVGRDLDRAIRAQMPQGEVPAPAWTAPHDLAGTCGLERGGYVQLMDFDALARVAAERDAVLELLCRPGHHLLGGGLHLRVWPAEAADAEMTEALRSAAMMGEESTASEDVEFAARQLVEIALRALSPGINDPYTAVAVIDRLGEAMAVAMTLPEPRRVWVDETGRPRLYAPVPGFESLIDVAFNQIRQAATRSPAVLMRLLEKLGQLAEQARNGTQRRSIGRHVGMVADAGRAAIAEPHDLEALELRYTAAMALLREAG